MADRWRPAWADIDLDAVRHNASILVRLSEPAALCAVVKADGYGHGAVPVARAALEGGARWLAVALVEEGVALREAGIEAPILLLSEPPAEAMAEAVARRLVPTVYSNGGLELLSAAADGDRPPVEVHLKVDTGMHRVGADPVEVPDLVAAIAADPRLAFGALWTHLAVAEGTSPDDREFTAAQLERFDAVVATLAAGRAPTADDPRGQFGRRHRRPRGPARPGSLRYRRLRGGPDRRPWPTEIEGATGGGRLRPVLSLRARVTSTRDLEAGERPSYGRRRPLDQRSTVATVPIGYADGVPRRLFDQGGEVLIGGLRRPLAGAVTMDQVVVDCGPVGSAPVEVGDEVVLLGRQGSRGDHRRRVGLPARHDQLRGAVRHRSPGPPPDRRGRGVAGLSPDGRRRTPPTRQYHSAVAPGTDLAALAREAAGCTRCPLSESRTQVVFGVGDPSADLMFVGEAPGRDEDLQGEPFVGRSGKLLDQLVLEELGVDRSRFYIANVVKCRPPDNRDPRPDEIAACRPYLEAQLALIAPVVVVSLGNFATKLLLDTDQGITKVRGNSYPMGSSRLVPTYHPAAALRSGGVVVAQMRADLIRAKQLLGWSS